MSSSLGPGSLKFRKIKLRSRFVMADNMNVNAPAAPEIEVPRVPGAAPLSPREELLNRFRAARPVLPPLVVEVPQPQPPPVDYDAEERVHMSDADDEDDAWVHDEVPEVVLAPAVPVAEVPVPVVAEPAGNVELQRRVLNVLDDVTEFIGVYVNARITPPLLEAMNAGYERLSEELRGFRTRIGASPQGNDGVAPGHRPHSCQGSCAACGPGSG